VLVDSSDWRVFTGNEMGCLLIWWMIHVYKSKGVGPGKMFLGLVAAAWFELAVDWVSLTSRSRPLLVVLKLDAVLMVLVTSVVHTHCRFFLHCVKFTF